MLLFKRLVTHTPIDVDFAAGTADVVTTTARASDISAAWITSTRWRF